MVCLAAPVAMKSLLALPLVPLVLLPSVNRLLYKAFPAIDSAAIFSASLATDAAAVRASLPDDDDDDAGAGSANRFSRLPSERCPSPPSSRRRRFSCRMRRPERYQNTGIRIGRARRAVRWDWSVYGIRTRAFSRLILMIRVEGETSGGGVVVAKISPTFFAAARRAIIRSRSCSSSASSGARRITSSASNGPYSSCNMQ
jgi:hypothetical protein